MSRSATSESHGHGRDFDAFVVASSGRLLRTATLLTGDRGRAEDLVQDAFAKAYLRWNGIQADDPIAYVRRCVVNANTDWFRRRSSREQPSATVGDRLTQPDSTQLHALRDAVMRGLGELTKRERAVIVLRYFEGLSEAEIAAALSVAPGTVKSTSSRALEKLRQSAHLCPEAPVDAFQ
jgi:RNA polymerase sigma-70 factor (sigma-E family)